MSDALPGLEPHGDVTEFLPDIFYVIGSVVMMPLMRLPRTMTVIREGDSLILVNAVRLGDEGIAQLCALGSIDHVVKIGMHGMDDAWYAREHGAKLWALPGVSNGHGAPIDQELSPDNLPVEALRLFTFEHTVQPECVLLHPEREVLVSCDSVQNWVDTTGTSFLGGLATKVMGFVRPAQIGPPWRKLMTPKGGTLQPDFERMAELPFRHLLPGHGLPLRDEAPDRLRETIRFTYG